MRTAYLSTYSEILNSLSLNESEFNQIGFPSVKFNGCTYWESLDCINHLVETNEYFSAGRYYNNKCAAFNSADFTSPVLGPNPECPKVLVAPSEYSESKSFLNWIKSNDMPFFTISEKILVNPLICKGMYHHPYFGR